MSLPSGTVTFLFTDIEGSTKLWEQHPEAMRSALARHDALLREAIESHNGHVFKTVGDAFCTAFATASDALNAALTAQQVLNAESWPEPVTLKVRMALYTGVAEVRDNDYFGQPLNRVARLLSAGHGGQVLLSEVTHALCGDALPPSCSLLDLGQHRLRDLNRPETIFQLLHPALPSAFPPLKSLEDPGLPNNLPGQLTSFIGREQEMSEAKSLLEKTRLLTLTGPGGCGKTRISLQLAADVLDQFPNGVWLVELAALADPELVSQEIASLLGVKEQAGETLLQTLTAHLQSQSLLLILDNCEHLLLGCAQLAAVLLRSCPKVKVLATSREPLGVAGESTYRVPPLSSPDPMQPVSPESLSQYAAVRLFTERAQLHKPDFAVTRQNAAALAQVCYHLDGIPLAIELAASRVRSLSVEDIHNRLDRRFRLLTGGDRSALPRQQTLRALMDWSYDLLNDPEKRLLARLSVFAGGWTLEAVEMVGTGEGIQEWEVLDVLTSLVDKSLVVYEERQEAARYRMLETVRQYAAEKLQESGEEDSVRGRHWRYFLALMKEAIRPLHGSDPKPWLERLDAEHDNLRAALAWCAESAERAEAGLQLAAVMWDFWSARGHLREGREQLKRALEREGAQARIVYRAKALEGAGVLAEMQGDFACARTMLEESLALFRELADDGGIASALHNLGNVADDRGDYATAHALLEEALTLWQALGDKRGVAGVLVSLGNAIFYQGDLDTARAIFEQALTIQQELGNIEQVAYTFNSLGVLSLHQGDYDAARTFIEQALAIRRELGDTPGVAVLLNNLGNVANYQGDHAAARAMLEESLSVFRELGDTKGVAISLDSLGDVACRQNDYAFARSALEESLSLFHEMGDKRGMAVSLEGLADVMRLQTEAEKAARLWAFCQTYRENIGSPLSLNEREECEQHMAAARASLGESAFAAAWEQGQAMALEQAIAYALQESKEENTERPAASQ